MKTASILFLSFLFAFSAASYAEEQKVGFIDIQRVIQDSRAGKTAKASFQKEFEQKRKIIEQKMSQLESMRQDFIKNSAVMNPTARQERALQIEAREKELQRTREDFRDELQRKDLQLTQSILSDIDGIIKSIGESGGYTVIFERTEAGIIYGSSAADITNKVIQEYDKRQ